MHLRLAARALLLLLPALSGRAFSAEPGQVLVVVNDSSAASQAIGSYYAALRGIPAANVFHLPAGTPSGESVTRADYNVKIRDPIASYLSVSHPELKEQVLYIALAKYVPLRVLGTTSNNNASVDSELTTLFSTAVPDGGQNSWLANPYFQKKQTFASFSSPTLQYLVCRLDGWDDAIDPGTGIPADVKGLIDRAQAPAASGAFLLDQDPSKTGGYLVGNTWMTNANSTLLALGQSVTLDPTATFQFNGASLLGYASWGSNDSFTAGAPYYGELPAGSGHLYPGTFVPGALTTDYVSTNGRTFLKANQSYGQSLVADLIHLGATGCAGYVDEPFLQACVRPDILFPRYLNGYDAIEAYYMAMPFLSWQNIVVVDPLLRSGVIANFPPAIASVFPDRGSHAGGTLAGLSGSELGNVGDAVAVAFDGVPAAGASFAGQNYIIAATPPHAPGVVDVTATVAGGTATKVKGFIYLPALQLSGSTAIGQSATIEVDGFLADSFILFAGSATASISAPPYGTLLLDPNGLFVPLLTAGFGPFLDRTVLSLPIPNDQALIGITAHFQAAVGNFSAAPASAYLSNRVSLAITP